MHSQEEKKTRDELRARFTRWLETSLYHARLRYLEKESHRLDTISLEEIPPDYWPTAMEPSIPKEDFEFEEECLAVAYDHFSNTRKRILQMLFIEEMKPSEISRILNCTEQYVYDQRYQAIKQFRAAMNKEATNNDA